ncbi:MAG TPA: PA14 domain-containing protein [Verrucomicrobiae bacterium]|nr:PA14 domain-containing protein [Verrucomicrobiae bacterium]
MKIYHLVKILIGILVLASGDVNAEPVLTYHNNNARTGANTNEMLLTPANVNTNTFGLLMKYEVDGYAYAQPLYVSGLAIPGKGKRNVVFVATANDSVYALDADSNTGPNGGLLWHDDLGGGIDLVDHHEFGGRYHNNVFQDMLPRIGITGTPVIDPVSGTLYVDAFTRTESDGGPSFHHKIHALSICDGSERPFSPVEVTASVAGTGIGSSNGVVTFDPRQHIQRPALTLAAGVLYVAYGSAADTDPYHGWIIGYDASNLRQLTNQIFNTTPNAARAQFGSHAGEGALWMGGDGLCVDADNNLYFEVANGSFDADPSLGNGVNYGDSFMKLSTAGNRLTVADYFTPFNQAKMQADDADFGSGGPLLLPDEAGGAQHPHLIVGGDKSSTIYLADRDNMGHYNPTNNHQLVQQVNANVGRIFSTPAYLNFHIYYQGIGGVLKAYTITNGYITPKPDSTTKTSFSGFGTTPSVSANGTSNAIIWTIQSDGAVRGQPAILHAYNATNLSIELYSSSQMPERDDPGKAVKMSVPTVADGKVFVGAQSSLAIFGNGHFLPAPSISPEGGNFIESTTVNLADAEPGASIYYTIDGTTPTVRSLHYEGPFVLTNTVDIRAIAIKSGAVNSGIGSAAFVNMAAGGGGRGLLGQYWAIAGGAAFNDQTFVTAPAIKRIDGDVDFDWSSNAPDPLIGRTNFVARWTGSLQSQYDDAYELGVIASGGTRLWVNGKLIIDDWTAHSSSVTNRGLVALKAQQFYNIQLNYLQRYGGVVRLQWRRPSAEFATIPQTQLYPSTNPPPAVAMIRPVYDASYAASASVNVVAEVTAIHNQLAKIEFFANGKSLGSLDHSVYAPDYALTVTGLAEGRYILTTVVTDGSGLTSTSAPVHLTVTAGSGLPYGLTSRPKVTPSLKMPAAFNASVPPLLSDTGIFNDTASRTPATGLIPYILNVPMWSDGAVESNFMAMPNRGGNITPEEQLRFRPTGPWIFPDGTVFIKNLDLAVDETHANVPHRRMETQILVRDSSGAVYGATYKWRPDNREADLVTAGLSEDIAITTASGVRTQTWYYDSPADCLTCHTPGAGYVLGVNTRQLNGNFTYPASGITDNQLRTLNRLGLFSPAVDETKIAGFTKLATLTEAKATLSDRVRSYLDVNCAQCHMPGGVGNYDARYDTPPADQRIINAVAAVTLGLVDARIVKPADTEHSVLYQRITSVVPAIKMPPLSHNRVDTKAVQVISDWINNLP